MNRLTGKLADLREKSEKAFVPYIVAGEPSWTATKDIVLQLEKAGVTAIELGVPFSDPIADGPVIQAAADRALAGGVSLASIFDKVEEIRRVSNIPILLMGYWNVFLQFGREKVLERAVGAGVDGFIIPDLPPEADPDFFRLAGEREICTVLLASTQTPDGRLKTILKTCTGFLYYVPQLGITGLDLQITSEIENRIKTIRSLGRLPVFVGIGIKTRDEVTAMHRIADGVIMGSRIVSYIEDSRSAENLGERVGRMVSKLM